MPRNDSEEITFEQLAKIQKEIGLKEFHKKFRTKAKVAEESEEEDEELSSEVESSEEDSDSGPEEVATSTKGRGSKKKPMEITSKRPVSRRRTVVEGSKPKTRDPRFDNLSGKLNEEMFGKSYQFLQDYKSDELRMLRENISKERDPKQVEKLKSQLQRMQSQQAATNEKHRKQDIKHNRKKAEMELVSKGKKPFFLKRAELKKLELMDKFKSIKESGNIDKVIEKRRKHNAAKQHTRIPFKRRRTGEQ
ncbi:rRNA biogenesis protein rrp36 [Basidiobolus ranarum]|uniref:rRNA biogenesis protein RRP36 n=1 Tax=Basidiobolus ranarum TaxID=34480 RepID=A0ABR2W6W8_9FUNG